VKEGGKMEDHRNALECAIDGVGVRDVSLAHLHRRGKETKRRLLPAKHPDIPPFRKKGAHEQGAEDARRSGDEGGAPRSSAAVGVLKSGFDPVFQSRDCTAVPGPLGSQPCGNGRTQIESLFVFRGTLRAPSSIG
jgi:hypothetical protein